jgi:hypothetical protein
MTPRRFFLVASVLAPLALVAAPGCSSTSNPTSRVALFSQLGNSTAHPQDQCKLTFGDWVNVGSVGNNKVPGSPTAPINDGDTDQGHNIHVTACSVSAGGDGFDVNVSVTVDGAGAFTVNGHFTKTGPNTGINVVFSRGDTGTFTEGANIPPGDPGCTADFPRPEMGVEAGRIWAHVLCPNETLQSQNRVCQGEAEFRFENCSQ